MSTSDLIAQGMQEISDVHRGEISNDQASSIELLRRAFTQGDQHARQLVQQCFSETVRGWLHQHPKGETACCLEGEEYYVAQTFERLWQATAHTRPVEFMTLSDALLYLRACLNGVILDAQRVSSRPGVIALRKPIDAREQHMKGTTDSIEDWEILQTMLHKTYEQRLAYLLFHCGLEPSEIVLSYPQEFSDVREIYQLRHTIVERLLDQVASLPLTIGRTTAVESREETKG